MLATDRLPPANVEAEELILGGILIDPTALSRISNLSPEAFSVSFHKKIFQACKKLHEQNQPTDPMSVVNWLAERKWLEAVGGANKIVQLVDRTVSAINIDRHAEIVAEKYYRRTLMSLGEQIYERACQEAINTNAVIKWALEKVEELPSLTKEEELDTHRYRKCIQETQAIELGCTDPGLKAWKMKKLAAKYDCSPRQLEEIYYRSLLAEDDEPMLTWEQAIEKHGSAVREWRMHGWLPKGKLIIEHGDGGAGKTRLSYNFLYHIATGQDWDGFPVKQGKSIVIQTDEAPSDMLQVLEDRGLANHPLIRYKTRWNIDFLQGLIREIEEFNPDFILIDSLTSINKRSIFSENDVEYARPLLLLKDVAQKYGITIIVIHHSSREGNARGSTAIRNSASEVWRLKIDNSQSTDGSHRVLEIEKSRSRKLASYLLRYNDEDGSWTCLGKANSENQEGGIGGPVKERVVRFLRRSPGIFFHTEEIQNEIGGGIDSVRRSCSELANEGIISRKGRRPALYGINFGTGDEPDVSPEPSGLSILRPADTTDQSVDAIAERSFARSLVESSSNVPFSDFRSSDRENSVFFAGTDGEKNMRSRDRLISCADFDHQESLESPSSVRNSVIVDRSSIDRDTTDQSVQIGDRSTENGSNVAQLNTSIHENVTEVNDEQLKLTDDDIQDFAGMIRQAIADPMLTESVQQTLSTFFAECPQEKGKIWKKLNRSERESFKALTAKLLDGLGREIKAGDRVENLTDEKLGTGLGSVISVEPQYRGSPRDRFVQWKITVVWDSSAKTDGVTTTVPAETVKVLDSFAHLKNMESEAEDAPIDIKAITLHQPWAWLVGRYKYYETRDKKTNYRGKIAIHAAAANNQGQVSAMAWANENLSDLLPDVDKLSFGAVVAIADLVDCVEMTPEFISMQSETELRCGDWRPGRYAWKLENVRFIEPIPAKGQQGLWNWRPTVDTVDEDSVPEKWSPKVGDRCQSGGCPLTIKEAKEHYLVVVYDSGLETTLGTIDVAPLPPEKDPKIIAQNLFEILAPGTELRALKHLSHKGFARRRGTVIAKFNSNGKLLAKCQTNTGIEVFNLEAVEVINGKI